MSLDRKGPTSVQRVDWMDMVSQLIRLTNPPY